MDLPIEAIKWIVVIGLIYYILDKTPIGVPLKKAMVAITLWCWHRVGTFGVPPELAKQMNELDKKAGKKRKRKSDDR